MILPSLVQLYPRLVQDERYDISPQGFSKQNISFVVVLHQTGKLFKIENHRLPKQAPKRELVLGYPKPSGSGINPCFLWDNLTYMLGHQSQEDDRKRQCFEAFRQKHLEREASIDHPEYSAVCRFLENWQADHLENSLSKEQRDQIEKGFGIFQILGNHRYVHQNPQIEQWWKDHSANNSQEDPSPTGYCLISGEKEPLARLHPKIKGIAGAQSAGASIVSFNKPAYESYGKSQSYNAPTSQSSASQYGEVLNALLTGPQAYKHRFRIADTTYLFWTDKKTIVEDVLAFYLKEGSAAVDKEEQDQELLDKLGIFLKSVKDGKISQEHYLSQEAHTPFYLLGLAPNAARISIRSFYQSDISTLLQNLHQHHRQTEMVKSFEKPVGKRMADPDMPANWMYLRETVRDAKEVLPLLSGAFLRSVLEGRKYPLTLLNAIIVRIRADRTLNYLRASIIRGVLERNFNQNIPIMIDPENQDTAYRLGRLFAVLEKTQEDSFKQDLLNKGLPMGEISARKIPSIRDSYYSSASATPLTVFPRLLRTYQHHLAKLKPPQKITMEKLIQSILGSEDSPVEAFPAQLNLQQQGKFAIGYYHQRKDFFTNKETKETK